MLKFTKNCKVCVAVKDNKLLLEEIFNSKYYLKTRGKSLLKIADEHRDLFRYESLKNHVAKHQFISDVDFTNRHMAQMAQKAERQVIKQAIESKTVFDEIINQGMEELQSGNLSVDTKDLLQAAKLKKEFQLKEQDQELAMAEMMWHFASGENNRSEAYDRRVIEGEAVTSFDPASDLAEDFDRRKVQSRTFYQSLAGDAPTPRSD